MTTDSPASELSLAAPAFSLPATDGQTYTLDEVRCPKGLDVIFMCNHCPYVQAALPRIVREARELAALGIGTVGINSNDAAAYPEDSRKWSSVRIVNAAQLRGSRRFSGRE